MRDTGVIGGVLSVAAPSDEPFLCICGCWTSDVVNDVDLGGTKYAFSNAGVGDGVVKNAIPVLATCELPGGAGSFEVGGELAGGVGGFDAGIAVSTEVSLLLRGKADCHS